MDKFPSAQVIVLNWNGLHLLDACLSALSNLNYPSYDILLVDNNSTDGSLEFVISHYPHVSIIKNKANLGYAAGNNQALRQLSADYALLVNPDIVVTPDWLTNLIEAMDNDISIGIAGCKLFYPDGTIQHLGGSISHPRAMPVHQGVLESDHQQGDDIKDVEYVTGATIAIKRSVLEKIGCLDEGFFMYFEEADWCARARAADFRVVVVPQSSAVHDESAIAVKGSPSYLRRFHTGRWRYILKHFDPSEILASTFTAEEQWLPNLQPREVLALGEAYRAVTFDLDEILTTRTGHHNGAVNTPQKAGLEAGLLRLRQLAVKQEFDPNQTLQIMNKAKIQELPFRSQAPLIGSLIARLRSLWARVAAREQAQVLTVQQNEFNQLLAQELRAMEIRFHALKLIMIEHDQKQVTIMRQQLEFKTQLSQAYALLESIRTRLENTEDRSRS